ncbi:MAG: VWA domain-containing protein [Cytophagales bacterium]|nr:VWA domain-containing protein [Cytophagales bacterium]
MRIINVIQKFVLLLFIVSIASCSRLVSEKQTSGEYNEVAVEEIEVPTEEYELEEDMAIEPSYDVGMGAPAPSKATRQVHMLKKERQVMINDVETTYEAPVTPHNTESYNAIQENEFLVSANNPLSTFSIDVDNASYTNARRYINGGSLPPKDAVRIEEFVNYFDYEYKQPKHEHPFSINQELATCPWNKEHQLLHIGLQGKNYQFDDIAPMNLVFLLDVSGSMSDYNKLPLLKRAFKLLVKQMRSKDHVSIVVYAGAAGVVLEPTSGDNKKAITDALDKLQAGGSTAGGEGLALAYKMAEKHLDSEGLNRIILATDGDFNVGPSSDAEMQRMIEEKRDKNIFMTVLGFGMGNYKDSKMESIADNGNGNYFYIDTFEEAQKVLHTQLDGTLYTIAKDVKIQIEFNPNQVKGYRLIGYENRMLKKEDFNNDKKDAGELGAGHTVTAIYEIIPAGSKEEVNTSVDPLKYQKPTTANTNQHSGELATVKLRYKQPKGTKSILLQEVVSTKLNKKPSNNFNFSAAVAGYGMLLRDSKFKGDVTYDSLIALAKASKGVDDNGYRSDFIQLMKSSQLIQN